jgi:opacity protein-like surface antigen
MEQTVAGIEYNILPNFDLGFEYLYNKGFVPLIMPRFTGDRDVESHTISTGVKFTF